MKNIVRVTGWILWLIMTAEGISAESLGAAGEEISGIVNNMFEESEIGAEDRGSDTEDRCWETEDEKTEETATDGNMDKNGRKGRKQQDFTRGRDNKRRRGGNRRIHNIAGINDEAGEILKSGKRYGRLSHSEKYILSR